MIKEIFKTFKEAILAAMKESEKGTPTGVKYDSQKKEYQLTQHKKGK